MAGTIPEQAVRTADPADPADVIDALGRVLSSRPFARAPRARGFLAYVVTETLAGRGERLSERTVARRALDRGSEFDSRADASVRVQAVRVRKFLEEYYDGDGAREALRIVLPRGSYVPVFERVGSGFDDDAVLPGVAVVMLTSSGTEPAAGFARSMSESLVAQLAAHSHIRVVGPLEGPTDGRRSAAAAGVSSVLTGHVAVRGERLTLSVRLHDLRSSEVLWTDEQVVRVADLAGFEVEERWAREIAAKVGDPSGVVIRQELARDLPERLEPELAARLAFYAYLDDGSIASIEAAVAALDAALAAGVRTAPILAMRAAMANTCSVYDFSDTEAELDRAESLAREALARDGSNVHAHLVLCMPLMQRGQVEVAVELAETAARLAPYQPFYLSTAGIVLTLCGEWQRGSALVREALRLHPGLSAQTHSWLAMAHLVEENYERALAEASLLPAGDYLFGPLLRALALSGLGYDEQARVEAGRAREIRPDVMTDPGAYLASMFRLTDEERARLVALVPAEPAAVPVQGAVRGRRRPVHS